MSIVDDYKSINAASSRRQAEIDEYTYYTVRFLKGGIVKCNYITNDRGEIGLVQDGYGPDCVTGGPWYFCDANGKKTP